MITPQMTGVHEGQGSAYLTSFRDANGDYLHGANTYTLHLPPDVPAEQFWSVTLYDPATRCLLEAGEPYPSVASWAGPTINADGSHTIHFGPERPADPDTNWVKTDPNKGWFAMFRFYGPGRSYIDKTWVLDDFARQG